jgi:hypothetical protein
MAKAPINIAASVKQRLLNHAREQHRVFEVVLVRYALERLLYRLSISDHRGAFVLKGGMLVTLWIDSSSSRETRDADFLGYGDADPDRLRKVFTEILGTDASDGLVFDTGRLRTAVIREEMEYGGIRLRVDAYLERTVWRHSVAGRCISRANQDSGDHRYRLRRRSRRRSDNGLSFDARLGRTPYPCLPAFGCHRGEIPGDGLAWNHKRQDEGLL